MEVPDTKFDLGKKVYRVYCEMNKEWASCPHCENGLMTSSKSRISLACPICHGAGGTTKYIPGSWVVSLPANIVGVNMDINQVSNIWSESYSMETEGIEVIVGVADLFNNKEEAETEAEARNGS